MYHCPTHGPHTNPHGCVACRQVELALPGLPAVLAKRGRGRPPVVRDLGELYESAVDRAARSLSDATRRRYRQAWDAWATFARDMGADQCPARAEIFVSWLESLVLQGHRRGSIESNLSCVSRIEAQAREVMGVDVDAPPLAKRTMVHQWRRAYRRESAGVENAPLISMEELIAVLRAFDAHAGAGRRGSANRPMTLYRRRIIARDRCMVLFSFYGAMRRGELHNLKLSDVERTSRGIAITFRGSKTDQERTGEVRDILPQGDLELCPVFAWDQWREVDPRTNPECAAFGAIHHGQIADEAVSASAWYWKIRSVAKRLGINVTPHSFRVAFATHASELHEEAEVMYHGRWKSRQVVATYVRRGRAWKKNPTAGLSQAGRGESRTASTDES